MTYITTFDTTFIALWIYYAVSMAAAAGIWHVWGAEFTKPGNTSLRYVNWTCNGLWLVVLASGAYFSVEGLTTFFATCVVIACVFGPINYFYSQRRLQRELNNLDNHMIDTLPTPTVR